MVFGVSCVWRSREEESLRSCVSRRCAATSFTFHFGARVCFSQSCGVSDRKSSMSIPSSFGKRCAVNIGCRGSGLASMLAILFCYCRTPLLLFLHDFLILEDRRGGGDFIFVFEAQQAH